jgi:hypothetical protein
MKERLGGTMSSRSILMLGVALIAIAFAVAANLLAEASTGGRTTARQEDGTPHSGRHALDAYSAPDGYGYAYMDNTGGDSTQFSWIELCGDPSATDGPQGDDVAALAVWGWNFPFYGVNYTSAYISTNGTITFDSSFSDYNNHCPYASFNAVKQIAPYWDDLAAEEEGGCNADGTAPWIRWRSFGSYLVVEWRSVPHNFALADRHSFEVLLYNDGRIKFQYGTDWDDSGMPNSASIGLAHPNASYGLEYRCNASGNTQISGGRAIWFYQPVGRCCYGASQCADLTKAICMQLSGTWTAGTTCVSSPCAGLTTSWINSAGGLWSDVSNWSVRVPGALDTVDITLSGTYTVTGNIAATFGELRLGSTDGAQTLVVDQPFHIQGPGGAYVVVVNPGGIFDVRDSLGMPRNATFWNYGTVVVREGGYLEGGDSADYDIENIGLFQLTDGGTIGGNAGVFSNHDGGAIEVTDTATVRMLIDNDLEGILSVNGCLYSGWIRNGYNGDALIDVQSMCTIHVCNSDMVPSELDNYQGGTVRLRAGSRIAKGTPGCYTLSHFHNTGLVEVVADTAGGIGPAEINVDYGDYYERGRLNLVSGSLLLSGYSTVGDSVIIPACCTLLVDSLCYLGTLHGSVAGAGTIHVLNGYSGMYATWWFTGSILVSGTLAEPATVHFQPVYGVYLPPVHLRTLALVTRYATFYANAYPTMTVDTLIFLGGKLYGKIDTSSTLTRTEGDVTTDIAPRAIIEVPTLTVVGEDPKELDSLHVIAQGNSTMEGPGTLSLLDSATIEIEPTGTLTIGSGFTMTGEGILYNTGGVTLDPQADSILIDLPVINEAAERSPGTIDILSGFVIFGGGTNAGDIEIHCGAVLRLQGTFVNLPSGVIHGCGILDVSGATFANEGTVNMTTPVTDLVIQVLGNDVVLNWSHVWPATFTVYSSSSLDSAFDVVEATTTDTSVTLPDAVVTSAHRFYLVSVGAFATQHANRSDARRD